MFSNYCFPQAIRQRGEARYFSVEPAPSAGHSHSGHVRTLQSQLTAEQAILRAACWPARGNSDVYLI